VRQLVTSPVPEFPVTYEEGSVERIAEVTRGQPYLVQAVCYELINHLNVEGRREATVADVEAGVERALESAHLYFAEMWRQFTDEQRSLLRSLARAPGDATSEQLASRAGGSAEQAEQTLRTLESRGTVERAAGDDVPWTFQVPLVQEWVTRQDR